MDIFSFFTSAAGGTILGPILGLGSKFITAKFIRPAEVKLEIDLLTAKRNSAADASAWDGWAASQKSQGGGLSDIPANCWPWVASLYVFSEALSKLVRPVLTLTGMGVVVWVFKVIGDPASAPAQVAMATEINFMIFTMWSWWFGERYLARTRTPISLTPPKTP